MCYHKASPDQATLFQLLTGTDIEIKDYSGVYYHGNGFSHPNDPVLTIAEPHIVQPYMWGFVPSWSKDVEDAKNNANMYLNLTCEKMFSTYKPFWQKRCLIFTTGFYEWEWLDTKGKEKQPYFIYDKEQPVFTMGGLYNIWEDPATGNQFTTYGIMTTPANQMMEKIHNNKKRMPLIIQNNDWSQWLDDKAKPEHVTVLLKPLPDGLLNAHHISKNITKRGFDTNVPEIQKEEVVPPTTLF